MQRKAEKARLQSAMEYLMTYGWAILIIAVVLGALFQLGVFNSTNFAPRAPPGSCRVARLSSTVNLEGVCSGELPQFVAQLNGQSSYANFPYSTALNPSNTLSFTGWIRVTGFNIGNDELHAISNGGGYGDGWRAALGNPTPVLYCEVNVGGVNPLMVGTFAFATNTWYFFACTFNNGYLTAYVNSQNAGSTSGSSTINYVQNSYISVGNDGTSLSGETVANLQVYNTSLDANQIKSLYIEGIGGAPVDPRHMVGWWPLNGDASDYSGNNNNGAASGVSYISSWINGYTPP